MPGYRVMCHAFLWKHSDQGEYQKCCVSQEAWLRTKKDEGRRKTEVEYDLYVFKMRGFPEFQRHGSMFITALNVHSSQGMGRASVSFGRWMDKGNMAYTYNGKLLSLKDEGNSAVCEQHGLTLRKLCLVK